MEDEDDIFEDQQGESGGRFTAGTAVSAAGHVGLVAWMVFGWGLDADPLDFEVTDVSVISGAEYAALVAATTPQAETFEPAAPEAPVIAEEVPVSTPEPPPPEPVPEPPPPEPPADELPPPEPPEPIPQADVADVVPLLPEPTPPAPIPQALTSTPRPQPRPAPRVAPEAALPPPPDAETAPVVQQDSAPTPSEDQPIEEPPDATAPEEATTEILNEDELASGAVETALRPPSRPRAPQTPAETSTADSSNAEDPLAAAVADAVADAASGTDAGNPGPPMTGAERDAFRIAVQDCWVVDPGNESARVTVTVAFELGRDARVVGNQVVMLSNSGGSSGAVNAAFEAARRAVLRCQGTGFPLPPEKFEQWRVVEMTFNPSEMRIR